MPEAHDVVAGRYELEAVIASGGMATVWTAHDRVLARRVALKVLHHHLGADEGFLERFRHEALAAARLTHPNVVAIYDTGSEGSEPIHYIVMEHCGGGTLADLLRTDGPFPPDRIVHIGTTICGALDYAHSKAIVHRDVKPGNVLIGDDGVLKVGDFGIAKAVNATTDITTTGKIIGTVAYISPEYAGDQELDARSDLYSLGIVLYELAVGTVPFKEATDVATAMAHLNEPPAPPRSRRAGVSRGLEAVILKALEKDPDRRYASAAEMRDALRAVGSGGRDQTSTMRAPVAAPEPPEEASFRTESRWLLPVIGVILAALVLTAALVALFDDDRGGVRRDPDTEPAAGGTVIDPGTPTDFDPPPGGDETEDTTGLQDVVDGDPVTTWKTDTYETPLQVQKPGVGILFDLGTTTEIVRVEIVTPDDDMTLVLLAGDEAPTAATDLDEIDTVQTEAGKLTFTVDVAARYWLVWITDLPGGAAGSGEIGEVRFFGP